MAGYVRFAVRSIYACEWSESALVTFKVSAALQGICTLAQAVFNVQLEVALLQKALRLYRVHSLKLVQLRTRTTP